MPTNFEIDMIKYSEATGEVQSVFDFTQKNMGDLKAFKLGKL